MASQPVRFAPEVAAELCQRIASSARSLRSVCSDDDMPALATWFRWLEEHEGLREQYARARLMRTQVRAEDIVSIADDRELPVEDRKVMIDARKWEAARIDRATYGDKQQVEHSGGVRLDVVTGVPEPSPEPSSD